MSVSSHFPNSPQETYDFYKLIDKINDVLIGLSRKTGIRLKEVGKGMGTDIMEESTLSQFTPDLKPNRPGVRCHFERDDTMPDGHFSHVTFLYRGISENEAVELSTRMGRALSLPAGVINPIYDVVNMSNYYGVTIPGKIFVERVVPEILGNIEKLAESPDILRSYSVQGKGTRFRPIEEEYAEKLDDALGTNFCDRELRGLYPHGIISIQALEGLLYHGDGKTREDIKNMREPIWDSLVRIRDQAGISKEDVPINQHPGHTTDLAIVIRDIQNYEAAHGPNSFFDALRKHRDSFLQEMRQLNPHIIAGASHASGHVHGALDLEGS